MNSTQTPPDARGNTSVSLDDTLKALWRVAELEDFQINAFRQFYKVVVPEIPSSQHNGSIAIEIDRNGLTINERVIEAVEKLRFGHDKTANAFSMETFSHGVDQGITLRQTVKLAYLIDPASYREYSNMSRFENDPNFPVEWKSEQTFKDFFNTAFPTTTNTQELWTLSTGKKFLKASKLRQRLKIRIERTDDLAAHLVYNPARKSLMGFHQVEWLKA
ncbi:hypothetical protein COCVIDRAFT_28683 [Bipolaris victoriae FI3]|uniref:Uncharacterized protein n=1 Tax=Bipolaris victoriae (strain FI3) TaxID=930091 RepID=W7EK39_BIPV3|nr:hypothetical protein COCVIDRAFT_28683 [Bipolaris victoriae FI3]